MSADALGRLTLTGRVDSEYLEGLIPTLARLLKKTSAQVIFEKTGMLAEYLASWTFPKGIGKGDEKRQETNVRTDIWRAYKTRGSIVKMFQAADDAKKGEALKKAFIGAVAKKNYNEANRILRLVPNMNGVEVMEWDGGTYHQQQRQKNDNGRVHEDFRDFRVVPGAKVKQYIKQKQKMAGWTKAAWINAGFQVNGKRTRDVKKWIWRHTTSPGIGVFKINGAESSATLTNNVPWVSKKIDHEQALRNFRHQMQTFLEIAIDKETKKQQRKK